MTVQTLEYGNYLTSNDPFDRSICVQIIHVKFITVMNMSVYANHRHRAYEKTPPNVSVIIHIIELLNVS